MNIKIQGGGKGMYANAGSCIGVTNYLQHEEVQRLKEGLIPEPFFSMDKEVVSVQEVTYKIDHNRGQLHRGDSKFFVLTVSPSKEELQMMGDTRDLRSFNFKRYINECVMQKYAENFLKGLNREDIMYYAKIHHTRDDKEGDQMHAHVIVSRKDWSNKLKLSPMTNHRGNAKGAVKSGFDRVEFFRVCETEFDSAFGYNRDFKESFVYLNTMKNGSVKDVIGLVDIEKGFLLNQRVMLEKKMNTKESLDINEEYSRGITR